MSSSAPFVTVDVFTAERYTGNQLAVVKVDKDALSQNQKQTIAREFNFSETVFLQTDGLGAHPKAEIFTPVNEMEFAGHPVIGTGHVLFRRLLQGTEPLSDKTQDVQILETKAGPVTLRYNRRDQTVSSEIPHNVHIHSQHASVETLQKTQGILQKTGNTKALTGGFPVLSIVKGVTYVLADLTNLPEIFAGISAGPSPEVPLDEGWSPSFTGTMYYRWVTSPHEEEGVTIFDLRVRMIAIDLEDPACGSGSAALAAYLTLQHGKESGKYRCNINQGSEIRRQSFITVEVTLNERGDQVSAILLAGKAALVTEGKIHI